MSEEKGNRVVVTDAKDNVERIRTDEEIVRENEKLEAELKGKEKSKKEQLEEILAEKKAGKKKKENEDMTVMLVEQQDRALNWGVIGVGQAGSKVAEVFYNKGYNTVAINTAMTDLKYIGIPERYKLLLDVSLGGAGGDLELGETAAAQYRDEISKHISNNTEECEVLLLCISGAGGTGSGSAEIMCDIMTKLGKPVIVLYILGMASEGSQGKYNTIQTLSKLAKLAAKDTISSLIVVDNEKIESIIPGKSLADFWKSANEMIVEPLHIFNKLSAMASQYTSLDPMDLSQILLGGDCSIFGMIEVEDFVENEEAIAEAIVMNLETGLLSADFDLSETRSAGVIVTGSKKALSETPASHLEYGLALLNKVCGESTKVFRGIYEIQDHPDTLRIYSLFSGLGLPLERIAELKEEAEKHMRAVSQKEDARASNMNIDMGKTSATSATDKLHKKIKSKNSAMGKLVRNSRRVSDRRRK